MRILFILTVLCSLILFWTKGLIADPSMNQGEFKLKHARPEVKRGGLLPNGSLIYYYEHTRAPTEEEKKLREQRFEEEWAKLKERSRESIPKMEEEAEKGVEEAKKRAPILLKPFFSSAKFFITEIMKMGMEIAYPLGKKQYVNLPVVTKAGFAMETPDGRKWEFPVILEEFYGKEEWERIPNDGVDILVSPKGNYFVLVTPQRGIEIYHLKDGKEPIRRRVFRGRFPMGFSQDGGLFYYYDEKDDSYQICRLLERFLSDEGAKPLLPEILCKPLKVVLKKGNGRAQVRDGALVKKYLFILTPSNIYVYDWEKNTLVKEIKIKGYGGRSVIANSEEVYIATMSFELYRINLQDLNFQALSPNRIHLEENFGVHFHRLVSVSPDRKYIAALFDPGLIKPKGVKSWSGSTTGESRLFIWDLEAKVPVRTFNLSLDEIFGGFNRARPVQFSPDWKFVLVHKKEGGVEVWERRQP